MSSAQALRVRTLAVLLLVAALAFARTLAPVWLPVFLGAVIAVAAHPLYTRVLNRWPRHPHLVAAVVVGLVMSLVVALLAGAGLVLAREVIAVAREGRVAVWLARLNVDVFHLAEGAMTWMVSIADRASGVAQGILGASLGGVVAFVLTTITAYYFVLDGPRFTRWIVRLVPLRRRQTRALIDELLGVTRAILLSTFVTAAFQGVTAYLGFRIGQVPNALVWATLLMVASILPGIGSALVWVPVGIVSILSGAIWHGVFVLIWSAFVVVGVADYVIRPRLVSKSLRLHDLPVFIGIFGGIQAFGLAGIVLGPAIIALLVALLHIYSRDYRPRLRSHVSSARPLGPAR